MNTSLAIELLRESLISKQDLLEMWVDALEATGVDNWEGYDEAVTLYKKWLEEYKNEAV